MMYDHQHVTNSRVSRHWDLRQTIRGRMESGHQAIYLRMWGLGRGTLSPEIHHKTATFERDRGSLLSPKRNLPLPRTRAKQLFAAQVPPSVLKKRVAIWLVLPPYYIPVWKSFATPHNRWISLRPAPIKSRPRKKWRIIRAVQSTRTI